MQTCCYCKLIITDDDIRQERAHELLGSWSHKICDEKEFEKIDRNMKIGKNTDPGDF